jgi:hypothetical protein
MTVSMRAHMMTLSIVVFVILPFDESTAKNGKGFLSEVGVPTNLQASSFS